MNKVKILHIITRLDRGGSAENTLQTVLRANRERYDVHIAMGPQSELGSSREKEIIDAGVKLIKINSLVRDMSPFKDLLALFKLYRIIRKGGYDVVHTHTSKAGFIGRLAAWLARTKIIVHTPHGHVFSGYFNKMKSRIFLAMERFATPFSSGTIALTPKEAEDYVNLRVEKQERLTVIPSGINFDLLETYRDTSSNIRKEFGWPEEATIIGSVGRLSSIKGYDVLVEAIPKVLEKYPETFFVLVGEGPQQEEIKQLVAKLGLSDKIFFTGLKEDAPRLMQAFDIFVLPSRNEGMGRVLVEAIYFGLPIVASNVGGIPDLVKHHYNGRLCESENPESFAKELIFCLYNKKKCVEYGKNGINIIMPAYSLDTMIKRIEELYEKHLNIHFPDICND